MPRPEAKRLLILGGTGEARALADAAQRRFDDRVEIISSLAGRTQAPAAIAGRVRRGGFGGAAGLRAFLEAECIAALVDATHPFATTMRSAARTAAEQAGIARVTLGRRPWIPGPGDRWFEVSDAQEAATAVKGLGQRVWLTLGVKDLAAFATLRDVWFLVRRVDPGPVPLSAATVVLGRGPFTLAGERALISDHRIDVLVSKASGGTATRAKLDAAREAGLPVVMIRRPAIDTGPTVYDVEAALAWIAAQLGLEHDVTIPR